MVYYRTQWDFLKDFPMSIIKELFLENPNDIAMRNKYIEAMEKYRNEYQRIINLGITKEELEKAGVPAPPRDGVLGMLTCTLSSGLPR